MIDPRQFEMALQQTVGQRMRDEAQLAAARVTLTRFETLLQQDSIARQEVDTQRATVRQLEASVVAAKATEGTARLNLSYTRIVAPIEGRVGLRNVDVGNQVGTSDTNGIAVITKMTPIDVEFSIPQDQRRLAAAQRRRLHEVKAFDRTHHLLDYRHSPRWTTRSTRRPAPCAPRRASTTRASSFSPASSSTCS